MRIQLKEMFGERCESLGDGQKLHQLILEEFRKGSNVELDFKEIQAVLTPFINGGFGRLFDYYDKNVILQRLSFCNISQESIKKINEFLDNADRLDTEKAHRETLEELFEEDGLAEFDGQ